MRESFTKPGTLKPNDRPISIVADEVRQAVNETLGLNVQPGHFNEQVLVSGLGDLGDVAIGDQVHFWTGVQLEVTDKAYPCTKLEAHNGLGLIKKLVERREEGVYTRTGILAKVLQTGELQPGAGIAIKRVNSQQT
jgi:MOSC domain-containing protein YiiM